LFVLTNDESSGLQFDSKAIQEMLPIIDPEEDYLTIVAAEEKIAASEAKRKKELDDIHGNLKCARR
jgi:kinetochore protein Spc24